MSWNTNSNYFAIAVGMAIMQCKPSELGNLMSVHTQLPQILDELKNKCRGVSRVSCFSGSLGLPCMIDGPVDIYLCLHIDTTIALCVIGQVAAQFTHDLVAGRSIACTGECPVGIGKMK